MATQQSVTQLLDKREQAVTECTSQILQQIEHITEAVEEHLQLHHNDDDSYIEWEDVVLSMDAHQDRGGTLVLMGSMYSGTSNQPINVVHFGIPMDMLDWTKENIKEYLQTYNQESDELDHSDQDFEEVEEMEQLTTEQTSNKQQPVEWGQTFDMDQLTNHQQNQLKMYNLTANNKDAKTN